MLVCWKSVEFLEISGVKKKEVPARTKKRGRDLWAGPPTIGKKGLIKI